jgi:ketosteroid isomerase-like protein
MKQLMLFIAVVCCIYACNEPTTAAVATDENLSTASFNIDSMNKVFDNAWNGKDSAALLAMMEDDVKMLKARDLFNGKDEIAKKWLSVNLPVANNLTTNVESKEADARTAYEAGTFALDVNIPNQPAFKATGNYTFIWKKQPDNNWKIHFIQIEDHDMEQPKK